jgi:hypothetical protein
VLINILFGHVYTAVNVRTNAVRTTLADRRRGPNSFGCGERGKGVVQVEVSAAATTFSFFIRATTTRHDMCMDVSVSVSVCVGGGVDALQRSLEHMDAEYVCRYLGCLLPHQQ